MRLALALVAATLMSNVALGHVRHGNPDTEAHENAWMDRQQAHDGTKCCNERDVVIGVNVHWRMQGGRYQVHIEDTWYDVQPGRMMRHDPNDPSPFGVEPLLFYTATRNHQGVIVHVNIWCFSPEPLT